MNKSGYFSCNKANKLTYYIGIIILFRYLNRVITFFLHSITLEGSNLRMANDTDNSIKKIDFY